MRKVIFFAIFLLISISLFAQNGSTDTYNSSSAIRSGVGLGSVIAVVVSWSRNKSILWAILHGILSWLYVIYFAVTRDQNS